MEALSGRLASPRGARPAHAVALPVARNAPVPAKRCAPVAVHGSRDVSASAAATQASPASLDSPSSAKLQLQREMARRIEEERSWWQATRAPNVVHATSARHFKALVTGAPTERLVVAEFGAPYCHACRTLSPKVQQIAASNQDVLFIKVNAEDEELCTLAGGLGVTKLPTFQMWVHTPEGWDMRTSLTANVSTVSKLRAEIALHKRCTDPHCQADA